MIFEKLWIVVRDLNVIHCPWNCICRTRLFINYSPRFIWAVNILIQLSQRRYIFWLDKMRYRRNIFHWWHLNKHHAVSTRFVRSLILVKQASLKSCSIIEKSPVRKTSIHMKSHYHDSEWHWLHCTFTKHTCKCKCMRITQMQYNEEKKGYGLIDYCRLFLYHWLCDMCRSNLIMRADLKDHMIAICMLLTLVRVAPSDLFESNNLCLDLR